MNSRFKNSWNFRTCLIGSVFTLSAVFAGSESKTLMLSNGRSGVNMLSASMMIVLKKPVGDYINYIQKYNTGRVKIDLDSNEPFWFRTHDPTHAEVADDSYKKLIVLTRNPKELILKKYENIHGYSLNKISQLQNDPKISKYIQGYFAIFEAYEDWSREDKILIFYEDLINDLDGHILNLAEFIDEDLVNFDDFIQNKDFYLNQIRENYLAQNKNNFCRNCGESSENGPETLFYTESVDKNLLKQIDAYLEEFNPKIWNKYLKRFKEE